MNARSRLLLSVARGLVASVPPTRDRADEHRCHGAPADQVSHLPGDEDAVLSYLFGVVVVATMINVVGSLLAK